MSMRLSHDLPCRMSRLLFAVALVLIWTAGETRVRAAQAPPVPTRLSSDGSGAAPDPRRIAEAMEKMLGAIEGAAAEMPRETFDPAAIVAEVGRDPQKLFTWVRDRTYWVPYRGSLRGAAGVLMDRLGNSLDRSLLLAEMLHHAGHKARLARGELTEQQAKDLTPRLRPVPPHPLPDAARLSREDLEHLIDPVCRERKLDPAAVRAGLDKAASRSATLAETVVGRAAAHTEFLLEILNPQRAAKEEDSPSVIDGLKDHWWVQCESGGKWVDLDTLLPNAEGGKANAAAGETFTPGRDPGSFELANEHYQEIGIRVIVEQWSKKDGLRERVVLEHALRPSQLLGVPVTLGHLPLNWPRETEVFSGDDDAAMARLKKAALAETAWAPALWVGSEVVVQNSFTVAGDVRPAELENLAANLGFSETGSRVEGILGTGRIGRAPGRRTTEAPRADAKVTAEWIEYHVRSRSGSAPPVRRQVFDLLGPAARAAAKGPVPEPAVSDNARLDRAFCLLGRMDLVFPVSRMSPEFGFSIAARGAATARKLLPALLKDGGAIKSEEVSKVLENYRPFPATLYRLAIGRHQWSRHAGDLYYDRPNILCQYSLLRADGSGNPVPEVGLDIIENRLALRAGATVDAFAARLEQGVLDTTAEAAVMGIPASVRNVSLLMEQSQAQGNEWVIVRSAEDKALEAPVLPKDAVARIRQDLGRGSVIVMPTKPVPLASQAAAVGWWRLDPASGTLLGMTEDGRGGAPVEYTKTKLVVTTIVSVAIMYLTFTVCVRENPDSFGYCLFCALLAGLLAFLSWAGEITALQKLPALGGMFRFMSGWGGGGVGASAGLVCALWDTIWPG